MRLWTTIFVVNPSSVTTLVFIGIFHMFPVVREIDTYEPQSLNAIYAYCYVLIYRNFILS